MESWLTCPKKPVSFKLFPIIPLENSIQANDISGEICEWLLRQRFYGWPGNCGNFVIKVKRMLTRIADFGRTKSVVSLGTKVSEQFPSLVVRFVDHKIIDKGVLS
jgi:hypothetical protein